MIGEVFSKWNSRFGSGTRHCCALKIIWERGANRVFKKNNFFY